MTVEAPQHLLSITNQMKWQLKWKQTVTMMSGIFPSVSYLTVLPEGVNTNQGDPSLNIKSFFVHQRWKSLESGCLHIKLIISAGKMSVPPELDVSFFVCGMELCCCPKAI